MNPDEKSPLVSGDDGERKSYVDVREDEEEWRRVSYTWSELNAYAEAKAPSWWRRAAGKGARRRDKGRHILKDGCDSLVGGDGICGLM